MVLLLGVLAATLRVAVLASRPVSSSRQIALGAAIFPPLVRHVFAGLRREAMEIYPPISR